MWIFSTILVERSLDSYPVKYLF